MQTTYQGHPRRNLNTGEEIRALGIRDVHIGTRGGERRGGMKNRDAPTRGFRTSTHDERRTVTQKHTMRLQFH